MKRILFVLCFLVAGIVLANPSSDAPIAPENVMNLHEVETLGLGSLSGKLVWSPDGSQLVAGGRQGIFLFDNNYHSIGFIDMGKSVSVLKYAPDGSFVFAYFDGKGNAFDLETKTVRYQLNSSRILAISEDEQMMAYQGYRSVIIADVATGETHYVLDYGEADAADVVAMMQPEIEKIKVQGITALVECSTLGVWRRADLDKAVSEAANFPIVVPTGVYSEPWMLPWIHSANDEALVEWMRGELEDEIESSGVQAGWIKVSAGDDGITASEAKVLRAAAQAAARVNAVIGSHTIRGRVVKDQLDIIEAIGYTPDRFI
jgi:hypothetical protein